MTQFQNQVMVLPSGQIVDSGVSCKEYARLIEEAIDRYECDHSDAEAIVDCQLLEVRK
jgi:hypothetical protein